MVKLKKRLCYDLKARLTDRRGPLPEDGVQLLVMFQALSRARSCVTHGPNPISWQDMAAWSQIMQVPIRPHHADIIMELDEVWLEHVYWKDR